MIDAILDNCQAGIAPTRAECVRLLELPETSAAAGRLRDIARATTLRRFGGGAVIKAQIGIDIHPCAGACAFCAFGDGVTDFEHRSMPVGEVVERAVALAGRGELHALLLMTMHDVDFPRLLETVAAVRQAIPACTQVAVNIGDIDARQARALAAAGVGGAYHVRRLGEGKDTALDPAEREESILAFVEAGIAWYTCCEPIGPEHSAEELADQIFLGVEHGCYQHATMRRIALPGTPMAVRGQVGEDRLAQVMAVVALATLAMPGLTALGVHEPNLPSLLAGANALSAESGGNPRDITRDTEAGRGWSVSRCKALLHQAGFRELLRADGTTIPLTIDS